MNFTYSTCYRLMGLAQCGEIGTQVHCCWKCKMGWLLWTAVWRFLQKSEIVLPYDPVISLLVLCVRIEGRIVRRHLCLYFHCIIIHKSQEVEATPLATNKRMVKENVRHAYKGLALFHFMLSEIIQSSNDEYGKIPLTGGMESSQIDRNSEPVWGFSSQLPCVAMEAFLSLRNLFF